MWSLAKVTRIQFILNLIESNILRLQAKIKERKEWNIYGRIFILKNYVFIIFLEPSLARCTLFVFNKLFFSKMFCRVHISSILPLFCSYSVYVNALKKRELRFAVDLTNHTPFLCINSAFMPVTYNQNRTQFFKTKRKTKLFFPKSMCH